MNTELLNNSDKIQNEMLAHKAEDGRKQTISEHLNNTAILAKNFAASFEAEEFGNAAAITHDIGKYDEKFQARLNGSKIKFEHSSAGAYELFNCKTNASVLLAYCVAGHHGGLPDCGAKDDNSDMPTLHGKLNRQANLGNEYVTYKKYVSLNDILPKKLRNFDDKCKDIYTISFFIRMIFSSLVDADYLDTESFMKNNMVVRNHGDSLTKLDEIFTQYMAKYENPNSKIDCLRSEVLSKCVECANNERGIFRLTVPTGGGKTLSSMAFALKHAIKNKMRRIIYVIPYTSIIIQTVETFRKIFGMTNVLAHYSTASYDDTKEEMANFRLASENWDIPIVVTTNVQFFESLFSAKPSKCRKLHNIADSVIILDEAQMLPADYLLPCIRSIAELQANYKCSAVLCTATQPAIDDYFPPNMNIHDIYPNSKELFQNLKRVTYQNDGLPGNDEILKCLNANKQVLCIVNSRKTAKEFFKQLIGGGVYHLSTYMYPSHIARVIKTIRETLNDPNILSCKVISTCLVEAGVDVDFPTVYREYAGLDSIIQAGGRCNRENKNSSDESIVHIFESDDMRKRLSTIIKQSMEATFRVIDKYEDISSTEAINTYFNYLFKLRGKSGLDKKSILSQLNSMSIPFATVAKEFKLIETPTKSVIIPIESKAIEICDEIKAGNWNNTIMREAGAYSVGVYDKEYDALNAAGCLLITDAAPDIAILTNTSFYTEEIGLIVPEIGIAVFE